MSFWDTHQRKRHGKSGKSKDFLDASFDLKAVYPALTGSKTPTSKLSVIEEV
jgi:hypothetical protein